jgi:hypothetical protein
MNRHSLPPNPIMTRRLKLILCLAELMEGARLSGVNDCGEWIPAVILRTDFGGNAR